MGEGEIRNESVKYESPPLPLSSSAPLQQNMSSANVKTKSKAKDTEPHIELQKLGVTFGRHEVLRDV